MAKNTEVESPSINLLGAGTDIKGDIKLNGDIRIDGTLIGSVISKGKVVIGSTGRIEGEIVCQNADISGVVKANITVTELLSLKATARLNGDIIIGKFAVEPGATFSGTCSMNTGNNIPKESPFTEKNEPAKTKEPV